MNWIVTVTDEGEDGTVVTQYGPYSNPAEAREDAEKINASYLDPTFSPAVIVPWTREDQGYVNPRSYIVTELGQ